MKNIDYLKTYNLLILYLNVEYLQAVHFSTVQLPIKPKDIFIHGSSSNFYSCFFDTKEDFMRYIEEELVDSEPCLVINDTDFDIDLNG